MVIDSLSGFEIALAPTFRVDFRESLYRLVGALTATGVTVMMTAEVIEPFPEVRFTNERVSFITDDILVQRYVEIDGHLKTVLAVVKMRGSGHATDFRTLRSDPDGRRHGQVADRVSRDHHGRADPRRSAEGDGKGEAMRLRRGIEPIDGAVRQRALAERLLLGALHEQDVARSAVSAGDRAHFLAEASRELSMSLDEHATRHTVRRLALPRPGSGPSSMSVSQWSDSPSRRGPPDPAKQALARGLEGEVACAENGLSPGSM